jgi:hypothetical protein
MKPSLKSVACLLAIIVGSIRFGTAPASASEEALLLHVVSDELQQEVRPQQKQWLHHRQITVQLFPDGRVVESVVWRPGKAVSTELTLGPDNRGRLRGLEWTRVDERTWIRRVSTESYVQTTEIVLNGDACTARLHYELRPGHAEFVMRRVSNDERMFLNRVEVRRVQCRVGEYLVS